MSDYLDDLDDEELDRIIESSNAKRKPVELDIPEFLSKKSDQMELPTEEQLMAQAMLNNVPSNTDIEKQNHLAELDRACQNWDDEEWQVVIQRANSSSMCKEIRRRLEVMEVFVSNQRSNMNTLTNQKL